MKTKIYLKEKDHSTILVVGLITIIVVVSICLNYFGLISEI